MRMPTANPSNVETRHGPGHWSIFDVMTLLFCVWAGAKRQPARTTKHNSATPQGKCTQLGRLVICGRRLHPKEGRNKKYYNFLYTGASHGLFGRLFSVLSPPFL